MYNLQINWSFPDPLKWATVSRPIENLSKAVIRLKHESNLSRIAAPLRVVDQDLRVYARYNPEFDWRLPGCFERRQKDLAYFLWEQAGRPGWQDDHFWFMADNKLKENKDEGIREGDFTQEEIEAYKLLNKMCSNKKVIL